MDIKILLLVILAACSTATLSTDHAEGFAWRGAGQITYLYTSSEVKPGEKISIQYPGETGDIKCCLVTVVDDGMTEQADVTDELGGSQVHRYRLKYQYSMPFVGIAVIGDVIAKETPAGIAIRNRKSQISTCLSQEGVHLFVEAKGKMETHLYLPLGYDVKPTCDPYLFSDQ